MGKSNTEDPCVLNSQLGISSGRGGLTVLLENYLLQLVLYQLLIFEPQWLLARLL